MGASSHINGLICRRWTSIIVNRLPSTGPFQSLSASRRRVDVPPSRRKKRGLFPRKKKASIFLQKNNVVNCSGMNSPRAFECPLPFKNHSGATSSTDRVTCVYSQRPGPNLRDLTACHQQMSLQLKISLPSDMQ